MPDIQTLGRRPNIAISVYISMKPDRHAAKIQNFSSLFYGW